MIILLRRCINQLVVRLLFCLIALMMLAGGAARADGPGVPSAQIFNSDIEPLTDTITRYEGDPRPKNTDGAYQLLDWLLYGGMGWGAACSDNVNQSPKGQLSVCGPQFTPSVVAEHNTGIQRTLLYGVGDIVYYPSLSRVDMLDTTAGLVHVWEVERDVIVRVQAQGLVNQGYSGIAANLASTNAFVASPLKYVQGYGSSSIQKEFGQFFTAIGGSFTRIDYQNLTDNFGNVINEQFQNGDISTLNSRLGYHLSPITYIYVEPSLNWQQYEAPNLNSQGYRVVAGIGTGRIRLFNGEVYAGYAIQRFVDNTVGTVSVPVFGGRLSWYPTRFLTFTFSGDRTFGTSDFLPNVPSIPAAVIGNGFGLVPGSVTTMTSAGLTGTWDFNRWLDFTTNISDLHLDYLDSFRKDDLLSFTGGVIFRLSPRLSLSINFTHQNLLSNFPGASFSSDFIFAGAQSKF